MIPQPFNDAGLIMQGMGQVGQAVGQGVSAVRAEEMANRPIDPALEEFVRGRLAQAKARMEQGADPAAEAAAYQRDLKEAIAQFGSSVQVPQTNIPAVVPKVVGPSVQMSPGQSLGQIAQGQPAPAAAAPQQAQPQTQAPQPQQVQPQPVAYGEGDAAQLGRSAGAVALPEGGLTAIAQGQAPRPQPQAQPQRINQLGAPPRVQQALAPMTQRDFERFVQIQPQLATMDQLAGTQVAARGRMDVAGLNSLARTYTTQLAQRGMDARTSATLAAAAARAEAATGVKVFDILMDARLMREQLGSREKVANINAQSRQDFLKRALEMRASSIAAMNIAETNGNAEALDLARAGEQASREVLNMLGFTNIQQEVVPGTPPTEGSVFPPRLPQPGTPDTTKLVVNPPRLPAPEATSTTSTATSTKSDKVTKTKKKKQPRNLSDL